MRTLRALLSIFVLNSAGCCLPPNHREPARPSVVAGWHEYQNGVFRIRGEFVLRTGESVNNGAIRITLLEILSPEWCAEPGTTRRIPRARIQFSRVSDDKVLCVDLMEENGSGHLPFECSHELADIGITARQVTSV